VWRAFGTIRDSQGDRMHTLVATCIPADQVSRAAGALPRRSPFDGLTLVQKFSILSFLCVLGITVAVSAVWDGFLRSHFISYDAAIVGELVDVLLTQTLPASYLEHGQEANAAGYERVFGGMVGSAGIVRVIVYDVTGRVVWSDARDIIGTRVDHAENAKFHGALDGRIEASVVRTADSAHRHDLAAHERLTEIYLPMRYAKAGRVLGVLEIYREAPFALLDPVLSVGWVVGGGGGLLLYLMLFLIIHRSSRTQARLERELTAHARSLEERVGERTKELLAKTREASQLYEDMKTTKEYLENLIASSVDGIVTVGARRRVTFASRGAQRILGGGGHALVGTSVVRYWTAGRRELRALRKQLAATGRVENYETELRAADGRNVHVNISASLLGGTDGRVTGVLAVVKDVTDLRKMQVQMVRGERLAAAGLLAAGVAHEVGNPLTCISSLAQVLRGRPQQTEVAQGLEDIEQHAGRIERILQGLTQLTHPGPLPFQECAIEEIVRSAMHLARHNPAARRMDIRATLDPGLTPIRIAPDQLLQVFLNLILNAADAGGALVIEATAANDAVRIAFRDTGRGMSRDQLRRLFDPFYSTKESGPHMGLGLFVSLEIVRQHGGTIVADSELGSGSTFTVVLPTEREGRRTCP
jgi:PAS domain S-box-containing protein